MRRIAVLQAELSPAGGAGAGQGGRRDPVRGQRKAHPVSRPEAAHGDRVRPRSAELTPQTAQEVLQSPDLRLSGRAADHRRPLCRACRQHGVFRSPHAGEGQPDLRSPQACRRAEDLVPLLVDLRSQGPQGHQVQVDGPLSQLAAPRQAQPRLAGPRQQGAQEKHRGAHPLHQLVGDPAPADAGGVYVHPVSLLPGPAAQIPQDLQGRVHVPQPGHPP